MVFSKVDGANGESPPGGAVSGSLGRQLVLATFGFCVLFTLLTVAVGTWLAWRHHVAAMRNELTQVDQVFQRTLSKAIWEMDREALQAHVVSAAQVASVGRIELVLQRSSGTPEIIEHRQQGWVSSDRVPSLHRVLRYEPYPGASEKVGELTLDGDERLLRARLQGDVVGIVITQVIQSVLLAGLIMWKFNRSVTVHVQRVARHLEQLSPENLDQKLKLERNVPRRDELSQLESGLNQLQGSLSDYLERQRLYERELAAHRDKLADLVHERTKELEAVNAMLEDLSRSDPLTGLPNRRHFDEIKDMEMRRAKRTGQPLSVLLCDVDFFKRYNDTYGHAMGDQCLKEIAKALMESFGRSGELPARIGGEEFVVLLPAMDMDKALEQAERVRRAVAARGIPHSASDAAPHVTMSVGVAQFDPSTMDGFDVLLSRADAALYKAKHQGRNQVAV